MQCASPKIGYVLKRFPRVSETFIANEILELERQGMAIQIFSLIDPAEAEPPLVVHGMVRQLRAEVVYIPMKLVFRKWHLKRGYFDDRGFAQPLLRDMLGDELADRSGALIQAAVVAQLARAEGIGHLHAHFARESATTARLASRLSGIPYSFTAHAKDIYHQQYDDETLRLNVREARFVVTVSEYNRRYLTKVAGEQSTGTIVRIYNGIDLERFRPDPSALRETDLVLAVGRLVDKKGFHHLVEACGVLKKLGRSFRCLIVGEGPERAALSQQIKRLELEDRVVLAGVQSQEQLLETLQRAAVFALPCVISPVGDRDALPTVLLEALAVGLPVVTSDLVGIPEIIEHGKTGLLVAPGDVKALAGAIDEILANKELRERLARQGPAVARQKFDIRQNVPALRELFVRSAGGAGVHA